jgi:hypothetical protein
MRIKNMQTKCNCSETRRKATLTGRTWKSVDRDSVWFSISTYATKCSEHAVPLCRGFAVRNTSLIDIPHKVKSESRCLTISLSETPGHKREQIAFFHRLVGDSFVSCKLVVFTVGLKEFRCRYRPQTGGSSCVWFTLFKCCLLLFCRKPAVGFNDYTSSTR